jgi:Fur family transcriptional regulator, ferric uptake regulator
MLQFNVMHHSLIFYGSCTKTDCEHKRAMIAEKREISERG